jgi:hypothetical protein
MLIAILATVFFGAGTVLIVHVQRRWWHLDPTQFATATSKAWQSKTTRRQCISAPGAALLGTAFTILGAVLIANAAVGVSRWLIIATASFWAITAVLAALLASTAQNRARSGRKPSPAPSPATE